MKINRIILPVAIAVVIASAVSCNKKGTIVVDTESQTVLSNSVDSMSWALGLSLAQTISSTGFEPNRELMFKAICNTLDGKQQPMTQQATYMLLQDLEAQQYINQKQQMEKASDEAKANEAVFFEKLMKENPNVKKSEKGFYYEVLQEGKGMKGERGLVAVFDYKGMYIDGKIFDQTYGNREPIVHVIDEPMMTGLLEGMCMMRGGSKYRFYLPSEMAYGSRGSMEENIPPYTPLIYEIEMHEVRR